MGINDLPKPGINFRATAGAGNFQKKLSGATRYGDLKNLRDNQKEIVKAVKGYEKAIRIKGGLNRLQKREAWLKIKKSAPRPTYADKHEIKQILDHLGQGANKTAVKAGAAEKANYGKSHLTKEEIQRNLNRARRGRIDETGAMSRGITYSKQYAGGEVKSYGVHGTMEDIGLSRGKVGFAGNYKDSKLPNNPAPKAPSTGTRPIGL